MVSHGEEGERDQGSHPELSEQGMIGVRYLVDTLTPPCKAQADQEAQLLVGKLQFLDLQLSDGILTIKAVSLADLDDVPLPSRLFRFRLLPDFLSGREHLVHDNYYM